MFSCECILAAALLTSPSDAAAPVETWAEVCRTELIALALDAELLDPGERDQLLVHAHAAGNDLKMLQGRFRDLAFAPLVAEAQRFPDRRTIADFLAFNRAYRNDLCQRLDVDTVHAEGLRRAVAEADHLHHVWNAVREARCEYYFVTARRESLRLLRDLIGYEAFYRGELPPYVPVWRFAVAP